MVNFHDKKPIYLQIKEKIETLIVHDQLRPGERIPSTNELVQLYKVNHLTVAKGINLLVEEGLVYKKRGVGMFVEEGAKETVQGTRKEAFKEDYLLPMLEEAEKIGMSEEEIIHMIRIWKERDGQ
ncbi:GntR family transcriptional regulator [Salisediminibacterium selenitireducens]|uniref:Transcriptional regulator, GntR family n=1 Tax=Bacillus selenitireducens (strain ATCC 700615 / DSM 15326 / MLS10) TaxID=439292 RepID=D6XX58_BACIE|nr:GntR family transcriptional regulator [Salisediminibacterium selenitireducens]ADH97915.1 transcriptional regulator, GntR family [[Bacillus] selenitireducens MLS10]